MESERGWVFDTVYFDATVRRSGNSLVITIPPELSRRFLIGEGQAVRLVGAVRRGVLTEASILVHLGSFHCKERATGVKLLLSHEGLTTETIPSFITDVARRFSATQLTAELKRKGLIEVKIYFGSIGRDGFIYRSGREVRMAMMELQKGAEAQGMKLEELRVFEDTVKLDDVDPSIVHQAVRHAPERVSYEWVQ